VTHSNEIYNNLQKTIDLNIRVVKDISSPVWVSRKKYK